MEADFPFARSLVIMRTERTVKKTGQTTAESHYYLSSVCAEGYSPAQWLNLIRGHWGGVEIRNHWRRDALMGEDRSRSRNANLLANVALIRSILLAQLADEMSDKPLPIVLEEFAAKPAATLAFLNL
jgi:predicted transposase YbfD/YdcC